MQTATLSARRRLLLLACFLFCLQPLWSRHLVGGNMAYEYLGQTPSGTKTYRFTLSLYRDCLSGGAVFDDPAQIAIYRGAWDNASLYKALPVASPVIAQLPIGTNCVSTTPALCLEEAVYAFQEDLPALMPGESFFVVYQRCCRAATLSNIGTPDQLGSTILVELTSTAMALNNSSPVFPPYPTVALCVHRPVNIALAATDSGNDILEYHFYAPFTGGGPLNGGAGTFDCQGVVPTPPCAPPYAAVAFVAPAFTVAAPMGGDPVVRIDSLSGIMSGTPHMIGQFLVGVRIREYRNRVLLSSSYREITFVVFDENALGAGESNPKPDAVQVFPNPASGQVTLRLSNSGAFRQHRITLADALGRVIRQGIADGPEFRFQRDGLPPGIYCFRVEDAGGLTVGNGRFLWTE